MVFTFYSLTIGTTESNNQSIKKSSLVNLAVIFKWSVKYNYMTWILQPALRFLFRFSVSSYVTLAFFLSSWSKVWGDLSQQHNIFVSHLFIKSINFVFSIVGCNSNAFWEPSLGLFFFTKSSDPPPMAELLESRFVHPHHLI